MKITDGTAEFRVRGQRLKDMVDFFFPVGAIYTCVTKPPWMEEYGEWQEVGAGRVLWGADEDHEAGTEIEAGLPNITGDTSLRGSIDVKVPCDGAFYMDDLSSLGKRASYNGTNTASNAILFEASKSNPIYGASDTVQPPAYVVHFYQRIS